MKILIVDQCSGEKSHSAGCPVYDREELDAHSREELLELASMDGIPAGKLYDGRQQRFIADAIDLLRTDDNSVDRYFISAGFGLVEETTPLPVYDVTFSDMTDSEVDERADQLAISPSLVELLETSTYDVVFLSLGTDYYRALDLEAVVSAVDGETTVVLFNQGEVADAHENVVSISAGRTQAKEYGTIALALKGRYIQYFAMNLGDLAEPLSQDEIESACVTEPTAQKGLSDF